MKKLERLSILVFIIYLTQINVTAELMKLDRFCLPMAAIICMSLLSNFPYQICHAKLHQTSYKHDLRLKKGGASKKIKL